MPQRRALAEHFALSIVLGLGLVSACGDEAAPSSPDLETVAPDTDDTDTTDDATRDTTPETGPDSVADTDVPDLDGDTADTGPVTLTIDVVLPPGLGSEGLSLVSGFGEVALVDGVATLGTAAAADPANPTNPVLASVIDRNTGRLVTFGFIDPSHPDRPLDTKNLAASAVFLASGGMQLDTASRSQLLSATLERPAIDTFAAAIDTLWADDPWALEDQGEPFGAALSNALTALGPAVHIWSYDGTIPRVPYNLEARPQLWFDRRELNGVVYGPPEGSRYRLSNQVWKEHVVERYIRRYSQDPEPTVDEVLVEPPEPSAAPVTLEALSRANAYVVRHDYADFLPDLESAPQELVMREGNAREEHFVVDIAPAFNDAASANDHRELFPDQVSRWEGMIADMNEQAVAGLVIEVLVELAGQGARPLRYSEVATVLPGLRALGGDLTAELDYAREGVSLETTVGRLFTFAGSGGELTRAMLAAIAPVSRLDEDDLSPLRLQAFHAGLRVFATTGIDTHLGSISPRIRSLKRGYSIAFFSLFASYPELAILPNEGTYTMRDVLDLTAVVRGRLTELEGARSYRWQLFGYGGTLDDGAGKTGTTIVTESDEVKLRTNTSSRGVVSVEVTLLLTPEGGEPEAVASERVTFKEAGSLEGFQDWFSPPGGGTWLFGVVEFPKVPAPGGGFKGGRVRFERIFGDGSGYRWREYTFPAFTGTPISLRDEPLFTAHRIQPTQSGGSGEGFDVYDHGSRLLLKVGSGFWLDDAHRTPTVELVNQALWGSDYVARPTWD